MNHPMWVRYTQPAQPELRSPEQDVLEDETTPSHHESLPPLRMETCTRIVDENRLRLGLTFCLWCGRGPARKICPCPPPADGSMFRVHVHPCESHNHVHPRGMCEGRCQDCGGCNMDVCTHFNPSGGPVHPNPANDSSVPMCTRVSEDRTRCYRRRVGNLYFAIEHVPAEGGDDTGGGGPAEDLGLGDGRFDSSAILEQSSDTASLLIVEDEGEDESNKDVNIPLDGARPPRGESATRARSKSKKSTSKRKTAGGKVSDVASKKTSNLKKPNSGGKKAQRQRRQRKHKKK